MSYLILTLVIIGSVNWLLVGMFEWDLVAALEKRPDAIERSGL